MRNEQKSRRREPPGYQLDPELARTLEQVGPQNYAMATAREFAPGGRFNRTNTRPRYAKT